MLSIGLVPFRSQANDIPHSIHFSLIIIPDETITIGIICADNYFESDKSGQLSFNMPTGK